MHEMRLNVAPALTAQRVLRRGMPVDLNQRMSGAIHINPRVALSHVNLRAPVAPRAVSKPNTVIRHHDRRSWFIIAELQRHRRLLGATLAETSPRTRPGIAPRTCCMGGELETQGRERDTLQGKLDAFPARDSSA